jgi:hypothetical protein
MTGGSKGILIFYNGDFVDYIVAGTDSGKIVIIEYLPEKNKFVKVHVNISYQRNHFRMRYLAKLAAEESSLANSSQLIQKAEQSWFIFKN